LGAQPRDQTGEALLRDHSRRVVVHQTIPQAFVMSVPGWSKTLVLLEFPPYFVALKFFRDP
jgi:hypothetical protein